MLAAYAKNEKADLSNAERNAMKRTIPILVAGYLGKKWEAEVTATKTKRTPTSRPRVPAKRPTVGARIIEGLEQAVAWTRGENDKVQVTSSARAYGQRTQDPHQDGPQSSAIRDQVWFPASHVA